MVKVRLLCFSLRKGDSHLKHLLPSLASPLLHISFRGHCVGRYPLQLFLYSDPPLPSPTFLMAPATSSQTFSPIISHSSSFYSHLPAYEDGTVCSETSAYKLQTPRNYPKESIQQMNRLIYSLINAGKSKS
jgi:hypothetical protein